MPRIIYIPGTCCVSPNGVMREIGRLQLRISCGFEPVKRIENAVTLITKAIDYAI